MTFLRISWNAFKLQNPINKNAFQDHLRAIKNKSGNFIEVKCLNDILKYWKKEEIHEFYLTKDELITRGGGVGNYYKSRFSLWHSKSVLKIFIGIRNRKNVIIIQHIRSRYKMVHNENEIRSSAMSSVMLTLLPKGKEMKNLPNSEFQFSLKMRCMYYYILYLQQIAYFDLY